MNIDLLCHILYLMFMLSMILVGRKKSSGWLLYILASLGWIVVGLKLDLTAMAVWSSLYALIGLVSWIRWKNART